MIQTNPFGGHVDVCLFGTRSRRVPRWQPVPTGRGQGDAVAALPEQPVRHPARAAQRHRTGVAGADGGGDPICLEGSEAQGIESSHGARYERVRSVEVVTTSTRSTFLVGSMGEVQKLVTGSLPIRV